MYIKQYLNRISKELNSGYIIAHCDSSGMITGVKGLIRQEIISYEEDKKV